MEASNQQRQTETEQSVEMNNIVSEQPTAQQSMEVPKTKESWFKLNLRGGGEGEDVCCGVCAGLACFECCECCC